MNKKDYLNSCREFLNNKINIIHDALKETQASANSDTKSSAGDKHETSRAMAHLESERLAGQLSVLQQQMEVLNKINPDLTSETVSFSSVVETENQTFFISTGIGKIEYNERNYFAIASNSPLGKQMFGKKIGDKIKIGINQDVILNIT